MALNTNRISDLAKENIQPVKRVTESPALKPFFQTDAILQARLQLLKQQDNLEKAIQTYEGDDPLGPYYNYITWLESNLSKFGSDNNFIPLLEEIIVKYKDWETYKQDDRFVQLVIKYINMQPDSLELYQLVYTQGLGTERSLLYLGWAEKLEKMQDFREADRVFFLGINSRAQPLKVLEDAHIQFQLRIARRMLEGNVPNDYSRNISKFTSSKHKNNFGQESTADVPFNSFKAHSKSSSTHKFKIYEENENNLQVEDSRSHEKSPKGDSASRNDVKAINKNYDSKRKQSRGTVSNQITASLSKDEKNDEITKTMKFGMLKPKNDEFKCPVAIFEPEDSSKKSMYPKHLVYAEGRDVQLEEIRAMYYHRKIRKLNDSCDMKRGTAEAQTNNFTSISNEPIDLTKSYKPSLEKKPDSLVLVNRFLTDTGNTMSRKSASFSYDPLLGTQFVEPVVRSSCNGEMKLSGPENLCSSVKAAKNIEQKTEDFMLRKLSPRCDYSDNFFCQENITKKKDCRSPPKFLPMSWIQEKFENTNRLQKGDDSVDFRSSDRNASTFHPSPSTSFTVNTRAAWNVIQKMWESPLGSQLSVAKVDTGREDFNNSVFKKPQSRTPRRKISFPTFLDDELSQEKSRNGIRKDENIGLPSFSEKSNLAYNFRVVADNNTDPENFECVNDLNGSRVDHGIYARNMQEKSDTRSTKWEERSHRNNENHDQLDIPVILNDVDLAESMNALKVNTNKEKQGTHLPLILPSKLSNTALKDSEDKENEPPNDYFVPTERRPVCGILTPAIDIPVKEVDSEDSDDDDNDDDVDYLMLEKSRQVDEETCNTKTFGLFLPSSTPFSRGESLRYSRKSLIYNGSYISEDNMVVKNPPSSVPNTVSDNPKKFNEKSTANLSLILENSKEQGSSSSSSGANIGTRNFF